MISTPRVREPGFERALTLFLSAFSDHDEQWAGGLHRPVADRLVALARPLPGDSCLDIGGGDGIVAAALGEAVGAGGVVVSVDIGARSVAVARNPRAANMHLMRMGADDVIFRDGTFDVVVLSTSIAYATDVDAVIAEAVRTLKVGGRLALFCRRRGLATPAEEAFLAELHSFMSDQPVVVPDRFLSYPPKADRRELEAGLRAAGLGIVTFGDVVTGGRAADVGAFNAEMMRCWPGARLLLASLAGSKRRQFDLRVVAVMRTLPGEALRYHHPYLVASAVKIRSAA
jgi:SAM-dependent methyltransferase